MCSTVYRATQLQVLVCAQEKRGKPTKKQNTFEIQRTFCEVKGNLYMPVFYCKYLINKYRKVSQ